jgi:hypothetical protein
LKTLKKVGLSVLLAAVSAVMLASMALAQEAAGGQAYKEKFKAKLTELNDSGAKGIARLSLEGNELTTKINSRGFSENLPHAQHIHGKEEAEAEGAVCPPATADEDGDNLVSTLEGAPFYGPIQVSFTTEGDTSPASGLALDRFPVANNGGSFRYKETFDIPTDVAANLDEHHIVQHGVDLNGNGVYDGPNSALGVPLEAELPATCGVIEPQGR